MQGPSSVEDELHYAGRGNGKDQSAENKKAHFLYYAEPPKSTFSASSVVVSADQLLDTDHAKMRIPTGPKASSGLAFYPLSASKEYGIQVHSASAGLQMTPQPRIPSGVAFLNNSHPAVDITGTADHHDSLMRSTLMLSRWTPAAPSPAPPTILRGHSSARFLTEQVSSAAGHQNKGKELPPNSSSTSSSTTCRFTEASAPSTCCLGDDGGRVKIASDEELEHSADLAERHILGSKAGTSDQVLQQSSRSSPADIRASSAKVAAAATEPATSSCSGSARYQPPPPRALRYLPPGISLQPPPQLAGKVPVVRESSTASLVVMSASASSRELTPLATRRVSSGSILAQRPLNCNGTFTATPTLLGAAPPPVRVVVATSASSRGASPASTPVFAGTTQPISNLARPPVVAGRMQSYQQNKAKAVLGNRMRGRPSKEAGEVEESVSVAQSPFGVARKSFNSVPLAAKTGRASSTIMPPLERHH
ncbi:unnamed protein product [Amoebophrya sp. A25]|nr:unnamed protein product [Amoebophrya sp. A25]|eukprot:GSA25T00017433001.1